MPWIVVKKGTVTLLEREITQPEIFIGRDPTCNIVLKSKEISRRHAKIVIKEKNIQLIDLESLNGTFLNGKRIGEAPVSFGDIINILDYSIILKEDSETTVSGSGAEKEKIGVLTEIDSEENLGGIDLYDNFTIGRDPESDISISDENVSWRHATFRLEKDVPVIVDNETRNGTKVNGKLISGAEKLYSGDIVDIGSRRWRFESDLAETRKEGKTSSGGKFFSKPIHKIMIGCAAIILLLLFLLPKGGNEKKNVGNLMKKVEHYERDGKYELALDVLRKARGIAPGNNEVISKINSISQKMEVDKEIGRIKSMLNANDISTLLEAQETILRFHDKYTENDEFSNLLVLVKQKIRDQKLSDEYYDLLQKGKYKEGIDLISNTAHPRKNDYLIKAKKGYARQLEIYGKIKEAQKEWQDVLALNSEDEEAKQALKRIASRFYTLAHKSRPQKISTNIPPVVGEIKKSKSEILVGEKVNLSVAAEDLDRDVLKYQWNAERGKIQNLGNRATYLANFKTNSPKELVEISVKVSDKKSSPIIRKTYLTILVPTREAQAPPKVSTTEEHVEKPVITEAKKQEAEKLYWDAYRKMQYKNEKAYKEALQMFEKVIEIVPDKSFEFNIKAQQKIEKIKEDLKLRTEK